jgi:hypothetical protein
MSHIENMRKVTSILATVALLYFWATIALNTVNAGLDGKPLRDILAIHIVFLLSFERIQEAKNWSWPWMLLMFAQLLITAFVVYHR